MPFEEEFARVLREAADVSPGQGVETLAVGAARRGRRRQRRRNALAGGVAFVVLASGGAVLAAHLGPQQASDRVMTAGSPTPSATAAASPSPSPSASATPTPAAPVSGDQLLALLTAHLSGWQLSGQKSHGTTLDSTGKYQVQGPFAAVTVDDGHGQGSVQVDLHREFTPVNLNASWTTCPDPAYDPYTICSRTPQPDGSVLTVLQRYLRPDRSNGVKQWYAQLLRPDGAVLSVNEWNTPSQTDYQLTRTDPPLTPDQLKAIALDPAWSTVLAALPAPNPGPASGPAASGSPMAMNFLQAPIETLLATAAPLLPGGLTEGDPGGSDGSAHFTVDDGHGKSLFEVTVQDWSVFQAGKSSGADIADSFKDAQVLADGSRVLSYSEDDWSNHPGISRNGVDLLRPNHLRVLVHSFNAASPMLAPTRSAPALTLKQLEAIADSPSWQGLAK